MSGRKEVAFVGVALAPSALWPLLHQQAISYVATWDASPGAPQAPQAPLPERILVAADNWVIRFWPFGELILEAVLLPILVVVVGRLLAQSSDAGAMRRRSAVWSILAIGLFASITVAACQAQLLATWVPLATLLVLWGAGQWAITCLAAPAFVNGYAVLRATGRDPHLMLAVPLLICAVLTGWGLVALLVLLQAWLFLPAALSRSRPTTG